eukprot:TRINITY_DN66615_c3_g2_i3.p3 TRINITY_DN66615_c3_g2~~TRINITY_DN66615_c3_g2_i3.p3  ORF type:complete len:109 (-),score=15.42 TRINITY_DN66615_c3_g2_i3:882-1208(-)
MAPLCLLSTELFMNTKQVVNTAKLRHFIALNMSNNAIHSITPLPTRFPTSGNNHQIGRILQAATLAKLRHPIIFINLGCMAAENTANEAAAMDMLIPILLESQPRPWY